MGKVAKRRLGRLGRTMNTAIPNGTGCGGEFIRGTFPLPNECGPLIVQFPSALSLQGKYDVATSLCVAAKEMLERADLEAARTRGAVEDPSASTLRGVCEAVEAESEHRDAVSQIETHLGPLRLAQLDRVVAFTIDDMQRCLNVARNTRDRERWSAAEWLKLYDAYKQCGWDFTPDEWTAGQVEDVIERGIVPRWNDDESPIESDEVPS